MKKIAIIGSGISGMASAYILNKHGYEVTLFEKNNYIGGHTNTATVSEGNKSIPIDTGFIVFNHINYPNLTKLFNQLNVPTTNTDMSFAVSDSNTDFEYCGSTLNTLFSKRSHILNPKFYKLILEINKFNNTVSEVLESDQFLNYSIVDYFKERNLGKLCLEQYILPMSVALWSAPESTIKDFPIVSLARFFKNHGLLGFTTQFQWQTVKGGSWQYRDRLLKAIQATVHTHSQVTSVRRVNEKVEVDVNGETHAFDQVVLASHADQTYKLLNKKTELEERLLSSFSYQKNIVDLHTDETLMPVRKIGWAAWNHKKIKDHAYVTYWMNRLQPLDTDVNYFVSLNASKEIDQSKVKRTIEYHHPIFDVKAMLAQRELQKINNQGNNTFFAGSYFGHGFHEDGITAAVNACRALLGKEDVL